jgi:serine/threonine protein kinase
MPDRPWPLSELMKQIEEAYSEEGMVSSWHSEKESIHHALDGISGTLPRDRYYPKSVLGVGGAGVVLRLEDSLFPTVDNALKFPRPVEGKVNIIAELVTKEISFLAGMRHPGIVKILFYKTVPDVHSYGHLPFYLMEAVDGVRSHKFASKQSTTQTQFLTMVRSTAEIINYLHTNGSDRFVHLDIKPENIVVDPSGRPTMIDLGTCKRLSSDNALTLIACTRSYAHPGLARQLQRDPTDEKRARGELRRSAIDPQWDLWSFGLTLLTWLGLDHIDGTEQHDAMLERLPIYTRKYLLLLICRLLTYSIPAWLAKRIGLSQTFVASFPISSSAELCELIWRLDSSRGPVQDIPELAPAMTGTIQAAPGVHVVNTPRLTKTLDHRLFRRLNSIAQLGVVSQVYPSAKHARREHSLGTYANVTRVIHALYYDPISPLFRQIVSPEDLRSILLTSLLHDIGQFPLAHDLEEIDDRLFDHNELTESMIKGVWAKKKRGTRDVVFASLIDIFSAWGTTSERILGILDARANSTTASARDKLLRSIISGPIDADKLDYLFRDARHTDVPYPNGVDTDRLFRCLTTVVIERVDGGERDVPAIGAHAKGKVAAEFLTLARYAMFSQVYWHHAVRVQKAMLFRAVHALLASQSSESKLMEFISRFVEMATGLPELLFKPTPETARLFGPEGKLSALPAIPEYGTDLLATDAAVLSWFADRLAELEKPEEKLIRGIMTRAWFKRLWVVSRDMEEKRWDKIVKAWDQLDRTKRHNVSLEFEKVIAKRLIKTAVNVTTMAATSANELAQEMTAAQYPWLLIDIPGARPGSEAGLHYVLESHGRRLRKDDRSVGDLQLSEVWEDYARDLRQAAGKIRVFCHPILIDSIDASITWEIGIDDLVSVIEMLIP